VTFRAFQPGWRIGWNRWALPPAAWAAIAVFSAREVDPVSGAEGGYLARLAGAILVAVAALAPPPAAELALGAALAVTAVWTLPAGLGRGAAVLAVLAAALATATARRLSRTGPVGPFLGIALCFGWQVLLRGELLFAPGRAARPWMALIGLPILAGLALTRLWRSRRTLPALAAAAIAMVLAPGLTVGTTLALVALAAGDILAAAAAAFRAEPAAGAFHVEPATGAFHVEPNAGAFRAEPAAATLDVEPSTATFDVEPAAATPDAEPAASTLHVEPATGAGAPDLPPPGLAARRRSWSTGLAAGWRAGLRPTAAVLVLALPAVWDPRSGWVASLAGLALWRPALVAGLALPLAAVSRFAPLPGALATHASWREGALSLSWLGLLAPAALLVLWRPRGRSLLPAWQNERLSGPAIRLAAAVLLAFATPWLPGRSALAAPLALAALALPATGVAAGITAVWSGAVLFGTALLASYPWLRQDPLADALGLLGAGAGSRLAAAVAGAGLLLAAGLALGPRLLAAARRRPMDHRPRSASELAAWAAAGTLFVVLAAPRLAWPGTALLPAGGAVLLDRGNPSWHSELGPRPAGSVVVESSMVHAADLASGTPVAHVRLLGTGHADVDLVVRAGRDTGDWAARRPDVASAAHPPAPPPWQGWVAGGFFGQRYRARLPLPRPASFARLQITLAPGLPSDAGLALHQVELEP
jgi:hypothetical protein